MTVLARQITAVPAAHICIDEEFGWRALKITRLVGVDGELAPATWDDIDSDARRTALGIVQPIGPRLALRLATFADQDRAVRGCVLVARQPARNASSDETSHADRHSAANESGQRKPRGSASMNGVGTCPFDIHARITGGITRE